MSNQKRNYTSFGNWQEFVTWWTSETRVELLLGSLHSVPFIDQSREAREDFDQECIERGQKVQFLLDVHDEFLTLRAQLTSL